MLHFFCAARSPIAQPDAFYRPSQTFTELHSPWSMTLASAHPSACIVTSSKNLSSETGRISARRTSNDGLPPRPLGFVARRSYLISLTSKQWNGGSTQTTADQTTVTFIPFLRSLPRVLLVSSCTHDMLRYCLMQCVSQRDQSPVPLNAPLLGTSRKTVEKDPSSVTHQCTAHPSESLWCGLLHRNSLRIAHDSAAGGAVMGLTRRRRRVLSLFVSFELCSSSKIVYEHWPIQVADRCNEPRTYIYHYPQTGTGISVKLPSPIADVLTLNRREILVYPLGRTVRPVKHPPARRYKDHLMHWLIPHPQAPSAKPWMSSCIS
ncbi:hypothetical protein BDZ97DRAFT_17665 [Flammula alnicola]|nr:hypothetical protein BDZ97DRAFT_17665 [Flammula alnicola]